jgi:hypothetical protein
MSPIILALVIAITTLGLASMMSRGIRRAEVRT